MIGEVVKGLLLPFLGTSIGSAGIYCVRGRMSKRLSALLNDAAAGVMAAGGVTFSDGTSGKWYLDRYGRLGLSGMPEGYRPSPEDGALFQSRLVELLQSKGLM